MPSATGQFGASNIVAIFQGFIEQIGFNILLQTRAAQNCEVVRTGPGQLTMYLNNVVPDDCNFAAQVRQFMPNNAVNGYAVVTAFPPVGDEVVPGASSFDNYINFGFYSTAGTPLDPNAGGLICITVFGCSDGLVGVTREPGNP
jgi:hypothetical protein